MKTVSGHSISLALWVFVFCVHPLSLAAQGNTPAGLTISEAQLAGQITEEVIKRLQASDSFNQAIDAAIQRYLQRQGELERAAKAEQGRLALERAKQVRRVGSERDHILGDTEADISLIEYSDFQCPFCKSFHSTAREIVQEYSGIANWVYRHFPIEMHNPRAQKESEASECAYELGGNDVFWKFADALFARTQPEEKGFAAESILGLVKEQGLQETTFFSCLNNGAKAERVREDFEEGLRIGITGTPTTIVLNRKTGEVGVLTGSLPASAYKAEIVRMLKE